MPAAFESDPRTERKRKPELFQKNRDRAKNEAFAIGLAGRKSHLLPKIGGARKRLFHQEPVPSTLLSPYPVNGNNVNLFGPTLANSVSRLHHGGIKLSQCYPRRLLSAL